MNGEEATSFVSSRLHHHIEAYAQVPNRHQVVADIETIVNPSSWPGAGWGASSRELMVVFGVLGDTVVDVLERTGVVKS